MVFISYPSACKSHVPAWHGLPFPVGAMGVRSRDASGSKLRHYFYHRGLCVVRIGYREGGREGGGGVL